MTLENTPPHSPAELPQDELEEAFDENDMVEVIEYDMSEGDPAGEDGEDDPGDNEGDSGEEGGEGEQSEIVPERDDAALIFSKHTDGVLCCAFHPKQNVAATGGVDDLAYAWDTGTGNVLMTSSLHEDSVEIVAFSYDGKYLSACDLKGNINVWNTSDYSLARQFELGDELSWCIWHHGSNVIVSSSQNGLIYMFKVQTGEMKMVMAPVGQNCVCGKVFPDGKRLACGYTEGTLKIVDLKQGTALSNIKLGDETMGVSSIDVHKDNNLVICGCDNGDVILASSQAGKVVAVLNSSRASSECTYIEAIAFCKDPMYHAAASGSLDGKLIIWDISKQVLRHRTVFPSSVNQLVWHTNRTVLYTSHSDGLVHVYDARSGTVLRQLMGHSKCIYSIALNHDGTLLMTTSEDKTARIYSISSENNGQ